MAIVILTLQLTRGGRSVPVATTADPRVLPYFKEAVLREWEGKSDTADQLQALLARLELECLRKALDVLIPEPSGGSHGK